MSTRFLPMRFDGTLTTWNDDRGFGYIEPSRGGDPVFVHISAWPKASGRPQRQQLVSFEVEQGPKGKRARKVRLAAAASRGAATKPSRPAGRASWGTASRVAIPVFLVVYAVVALLWRPPIWVALLYLAASLATLLVYALDKSAAERGAWRTPENTLHMLSLVGGWPGALVAQQLLRHKTNKRGFRQVFWATVIMNMAALIVLASPWGPLVARHFLR